MFRVGVLPIVASGTAVRRIAGWANVSMDHRLMLELVSARVVAPLHEANGT